VSINKTNMKEVINRKKYKAYLLKITLLIIGSFTILAFLSVLNQWLLLMLCVFILLTFLYQKFTESISVTFNVVKITYARFFISNSITIPVSELKIEVIETAAFRGGKYLQVRFFTKNRLVYVVDSRDGFSEDELREATNWLKQNG